MVRCPLDNVGGKSEGAKKHHAIFRDGRYSLLGPDSYEAARVKAEIWRPWRTRQCGIEDTAAPSPRWRRWSSPEAACGAPKAQGLRNVATSVIIRSGLLRSAVVDLPSI